MREPDGLDDFDPTAPRAARTGGGTNAGRPAAEPVDLPDDTGDATPQSGTGSFGAAASAIAHDPVGFAGNLVRATGEGFLKFGGNVANHLASVASDAVNDIGGDNGDNDGDDGQDDSDSGDSGDSGSDSGDSTQSALTPDVPHFTLAHAEALDGFDAANPADIGEPALDVDD